MMENDGKTAGNIDKIRKLKNILTNFLLRNHMD